MTLYVQPTQPANVKPGDVWVVADREQWVSALQDRFDDILGDFPEHNRFDEHEALLGYLMAAVTEAIHQ